MISRLLPHVQGQTSYLLYPPPWRAASCPIISALIPIKHPQVLLNYSALLTGERPHVLLIVPLPGERRQVLRIVPCSPRRTMWGTSFEVIFTIIPYQAIFGKASVTVGRCRVASVAVALLQPLL